MSRFSDFLRRAKNTSCSVVVVAAGASTRMGEDKLFMDLAGKPVLARTLTALNLWKRSPRSAANTVSIRLGRSLSAALRAPNPRWPVSYRSGAMQIMYSFTMALVRL